MRGVVGMPFSTEFQLAKVKNNSQSTAIAMADVKHCHLSCKEVEFDCSVQSWWWNGVGCTKCGQSQVLQECCSVGTIRIWLWSFLVMCFWVTDKTWQKMTLHLMHGKMQKSFGSLLAAKCWLLNRMGHMELQKQLPSLQLNSVWLIFDDSGNFSVVARLCVEFVVRAQLQQWCTKRCNKAKKLNHFCILSETFSWHMDKGDVAPVDEITDSPHHEAGNQDATKSLPMAKLSCSMAGWHTCQKQEWLNGQKSVAIQRWSVGTWVILQQQRESATGSSVACWFAMCWELHPHPHWLAEVATGCCDWHLNGQSLWFKFQTMFVTWQRHDVGLVRGQLWNECPKPRDQWQVLGWSATA